MCAVFLKGRLITPILESGRRPARITPYPTGRLFGGGAVPGTSCQARHEQAIARRMATIAPSLRDWGQTIQDPGTSRLAWPNLGLSWPVGPKTRVHPHPSFRQMSKLQRAGSLS